ncbi:MAG: ribonuclease III domain-containing protein [Erysipelotrichaceae bacterium]
MDIKGVSSNSLSFIGDAVYTLYVREHCVSITQQSFKLQKMCNGYNSAKGQSQAFQYLKDRGFFSEEELEIFKRGRNAIRHIPKNGDRLSYETASGLEAVTGYLYLTKSDKLDEMFRVIFEEMCNE